MPAGFVETDKRNYNLFSCSPSIKAGDHKLFSLTDVDLPWNRHLSLLKTGIMVLFFSMY
jgi:hypothetical protein